jgi:hypothetical protein
MNEIGLVEFEVSQPLFFDSYSSNRTTGSLILIDPLSNATVGAVMIRHERGGETNLVIGTGGVTPEERATRRGHRSAIVVMEGNHAQVELLERALWEEGLDAISIRADQASSANEVLRRLWDLGLVFVIWDDNNNRRIDRAFYTDIAADFYFEILPHQFAESSPDFFDAALRIAERVKLNGTTPSKGIR